MTQTVLHPVGTTVSTIVNSIGGRSETVTGEVVEHKRRRMVVQTACHGRIVVSMGEVIAPQRCNHADSLYGRCMDCGMPWKQQAANA